MLFCMCAPSPLPAGLLQPALCVCVKWSVLSALSPSLSPQLKKRALDQLRLVKSKPQRSPEQPPQQLWLDPCSGELLPLCLPHHPWGDPVVPCGHWRDIGNWDASVSLPKIPLITLLKGFGEACACLKPLLLFPSFLGLSIASVVLTLCGE